VNRLLLAELRRIGARRLVRLLILLIGIAAIGGGLLAFLTTSPLSESGIPAAGPRRRYPPDRRPDRGPSLHPRTRTSRLDRVT
jgi:hypothetical protein